MNLRKQCNMTVVSSREPESGNQWVAHCLALDLVVHGNSLAESLDAIQEAIVMVVEDDVSAGLDPLDREAPADARIEFSKLMDRGVRTLSRDEFEQSLRDDSRIDVCVVCFNVVRPLHPKLDPEIGSEESASFELPPVWMMARELTSLRGSQIPQCH